MDKKSVFLVMLALLGFLGSWLVVASPVRAQSKPLTNQTVMQMVKAGLDNQTIIKAIQANKTNFDVSAQALVTLKNRGVNQTVIQAMLSRTTAEESNAVTASGAAANAKESPSAATNPNNPMSPHPSGIYWESLAGHNPRMVELGASTYSRGKTSGVFGAAMSMGLAKAKWKVVVSGARASLHIPDSTPEFWFYFPNGGSAFSSGPSSPADFTLVKLERHHSDRELVVGKVGAFGASNGVPSKDTVAVESKQVAPGIYEVRPSEHLKSGEYAFVPVGEGVVLSSAGGKLFDFEVDARP